MLQQKTKVIVLLFILLLGAACTKPEQAENKPLVYTHLVDEYSPDLPGLILCSAVVVDEGSSSVTKRGLIVAADPEPDMDNYHFYVFDTLGTGSFYAVFPYPYELQSSIYVRAFATNAYGTSFGNTQWAIRPYLVPVFSEMSAVVSDLFTIELRAVVTKFNENFILQQGWVWSETNQNKWPTLEDCLGFTEEDPGMNPIISVIHNLPTDKSHRFRPYIRAQHRTYYSESSVYPYYYSEPSVNFSWTYLDATSLLLSGQAFYSHDNNMIRIGETGFCYSDMHTPSINDNVIHSGCCSYAPFHAAANNLESGNTYYFRAFAYFHDSLFYSRTDTILMP
jgi:hypothetical protein